jgi:hypothetical protein
MKDPFEEFEFKPLTEGLGFHKKAEKPIKAPISLRNMSLDIIEDSPLNPPLPRENKNPNNRPSSDSSTAVDEILQTLRSKKMPAMEPAPATKVVVRLKPTVSSLSAMFLDSMLILAGSLLCMIVLLSITKADVAATLFSENPDMTILISTLALFGAVVRLLLFILSPIEYFWAQHRGNGLTISLWELQRTWALFIMPPELSFVLLLLY